jgi:hypothetical protein
VAVTLIPVISSNESSLHNRGQCTCRRAQYAHMTYITTYPPSGAHAFNTAWTALHTSKECIRVLWKWSPDIPRSTHSGYTVVTRRMTDCNLYRTIGIVLKQPRLEGTGPEFTSPGGRRLTFLPWRRCVVTKSKYRK